MKVTRLILTRCYGQQTIFFLPDGTVMTIAVRPACGERVSLTIEAPDSVNVVREELCQRRATP